MLCAAILGTNYYGVDGKMAQATILTTFEFGAPFSLNNISPIEGVGSQLLPMNVWVNPAYWPFALVHKELATDLSAIIALGIFALACYLMARCFDVPVCPASSLRSRRSCCSRRYCSFCTCQRCSVLRLATLSSMRRT